MRRCLTPVVVALAMSFPLTAAAQQKSSCPPGAWFCAEADPPPPPPKAAKPDKAALPPPPEDEPAPPPRRRKRAVPPPPADGQPPVVIYQPVPNEPPDDLPPGRSRYGHPARPIPGPPAAPKPRWQSEWGLNLRVEGLALGHTNGAAGNTGMGGVGLSLRYRPVPHFALDLGFDFLAGNDYNGFERTEIPVSLNGIIYVNPRNVVQFYLLGGMSVSHAEVRSDTSAPQLSSLGNQYGTSYTYFGGQGGAGLEFRVSKRVALNVDVLGFARRRIDGGDVPEFIDYNSGRTSNASGGALVRGGLTFWW